MRYLEPLGLARTSILVTDLWPYYLATTAVGDNGRSMAANVKRYEAASGVKTAVEPRPAPDALLEQARELPGNLDRLADILGSPALRLLLTLGNESAAFVRGLRSARAAQEFLYQPVVELEFLGRTFWVAHLTHPGNLMRKQSGWHRIHEAWCSGTGRIVIAEALGG